MSTKQHRNMHATQADAEALESLRHMTSWARESVAADEAKTTAASRINSLVDCFALGATAFHPGPWVYPIDLVRESHVEAFEDDRPRAPWFGVRAVRAISNGLIRFFDYVHERRSIARATAMLSQMDDRSLQDIGITRADVGRAARHGRDWERWH